MTGETRLCVLKQYHYLLARNDRLRTPLEALMMIRCPTAKLEIQISFMYQGQRPPGFEI